MAHIWYVRNSNLVTLEGLKNTADGTYINSSSDVDMTLLDEDGGQIAGETWPLAMSYVAASNGNYQATPAAGLAISEGQKIRVRVTVTHEGLKFEKDLPLRVDARTKETEP